MRLKRNNAAWVAALVSLVLLFSGSDVIAAGAPVAVIQSTDGDVQIDGEDGWEPAEVERALAEGARVRAGKGGEALITWQQGHVVKVFELSTVEIKKMELDEGGALEKSELSIDKGKIFTKTKKLMSTKSSFIIKTPSAIAGVRGTEFMVEVTADKTSIITLLEGKLDVIGKQVELILEENMQIEIAPETETAPKPAEIPAEVRDELEAESSAIEATIEETEPVETESTEADDTEDEAEAADDTEETSTEEQEDAGTEETTEDELEAQDIINEQIIEEAVQNTIEEVIQSSQQEAESTVIQEDIPPIPPPR